MTRTCVVCDSRSEARLSSRYRNDACRQKGHELRHFAATLDVGAGAALAVLTANRSDDSGRVVRSGVSG